MELELGNFMDEYWGIIIANRAEKRVLPRMAHSNDSS